VTPAGREKRASSGEPPRPPHGGVGDPAGPAGAGVLDVLVDRLERAHVEVRRVAAGAVAAEVAAVCVERGARRLGVPPGLPAEWLPPGVDVVEDHELTPAELDGLDAALTGCMLAVAETGSLVLAAGPADGRRALSLVPDVYVCVVREEQVEPDLPSAFVRLAPLIREAGRPVVFVSGPSATSDIELHRVEGVHGPRHLVVLLVASGAAG
jgi:L-lactate dehydrogenase complex protein LldG